VAGKTGRIKGPTFFVMPGLVPGIHAFAAPLKTWMAVTSPAMTIT